MNWDAAVITGREVSFDKFVSCIALQIEQRFQIAMLDCSFSFARDNWLSPVGNAKTGLSDHREVVCPISHGKCL